MIEELTLQKHSLGLRVEELEVKVHNLFSSVQEKGKEAEVFFFSPVDSRYKHVAPFTYSRA